MRARGRLPGGPRVSLLLASHRIKPKIINMANKLLFGLLIGALVVLCIFLSAFSIVQKFQKIVTVNEVIALSLIEVQPLLILPDDFYVSEKQFSNYVRENTAIVGAFATEVSKFQKIVNIRITDPKNRIAYLLNHGDDFNGNWIKIWNSRSINETKVYINFKFRMKVVSRVGLFPQNKVLTEVIYGK